MSNPNGAEGAAYSTLAELKGGGAAALVWERVEPARRARAASAGESAANGPGHLYFALTHMTLRLPAPRARPA